MREMLRDYEDATRDTARNDIYDDNVGHGIGKHSDPTAMAAIDAIEGGTKEIQRIRAWLWVIHNVVEFYKGTSNGQLIDLYYNQKLSCDEVAKEMGTTKQWFFETKGEIVTKAFTAAVQKKLLKVF